MRRRTAPLLPRTPGARAGSAMRWRTPQITVRIVDGDEGRAEPRLPPQDYATNVLTFAHDDQSRWPRRPGAVRRSW